MTTEEEPKSLDDLTMLVVRKRKSVLYNEKILPIYNTIKEITKAQLRLEDNVFISYASNYVMNLNTDSLDSVNIIMLVEEEFYEKPECAIPDEEAEKIQTVYGAVAYLLGDESAKVYDSDAKDAVEKSREIVSSVYKQVGEIVKACSKGEIVGLATLVQGIMGLDKAKFEEQLNSQVVKNPAKTKELMKGTVYNIVKYVAQRDVKL